MVHFFSLLGSGSFVEVLAWFLDNPSAKATAAQLVRKTGLAKRSVYQAVEKLAGTGLLKREVVGRASVYSLERGSPLAKELKRLKTVAWLGEKLAKQDFEGLQVFLYGSAGRGEDSEKSDVDLLVIGGEEKRRSPRVAGLASEKTRVVFMTPTEYADLARNDKAFYESIERDKIKLV